MYFMGFWERFGVEGFVCWKGVGNRTGVLGLNVATLHLSVVCCFVTGAVISLVVLVAPSVHVVEVRVGEAAEASHHWVSAWGSS